jgi:hypothetical protein
MDVTEAGEEHLLCPNPTRISWRRDHLADEDTHCIHPSSADPMAVTHKHFLVAATLKYRIDDWLATLPHKLSASNCWVRKQIVARSAVGR